MEAAATALHLCNQWTPTDRVLLRFLCGEGVVSHAFRADRISDGLLFMLLQLVNFDRPRPISDLCLAGRRVIFHAILPLLRKKNGFLVLQTANLHSPRRFKYAATGDILAGIRIEAYKLTPHFLAPFYASLGSWVKTKTY